MSLPIPTKEINEFLNDKRNKTNNSFKRSKLISQIEEINKLSYKGEMIEKQIIIMKEIYNELSKNYNGISENKIEWNIVKSINAMNDMTDSEILSKNFKYNIRPTPKYFLNEILNIYYKNAI